MEHIWFSKRTNAKEKKKLRKVVFFQFEKKEKKKKEIKLKLIKNLYTF